MTDPIITALVALKQRVMKCEKDIARASYENNLYKLGRDQGFLAGIEEAIGIVEGVIEMNEEEERSR
jgi:hypothetical protein